MTRLPAVMYLSLALATPVSAITLEKQQNTASSYAPDTGAIERIESAELLRTYTQEVAAAACFLYNGIDPDFSAELVREARFGFDTHLNALLNGDETLGIIGGEERKKTIAKLELIRDDWARLATSVDALLADPQDSDAISSIKAENMPLFDKTDILVSEMEGQYADPSILLQVDVIMLEIVGRQAMMTQKIAKNACKIWTGNDSQQIKDMLSQAMSIYEASLNALLNGMPALGIKPAPTPEIRLKLETVLNAWTEVRPKFDAILSGAEVPREKQESLFRHMADEMHLLEDITHDYVLFAKHLN